MREKTTQNGISIEGAKRIQEILKKHRTIIGIGLDGEKPAAVKEMKIILDQKNM